MPRPLTPEQDQLIQQELLRRNDFCSNVLLLIRHTGMRIGECIDLSVGLPARRRTRPVGHPCTPRQTKNRTLGSRGFPGLSIGGAAPFHALTGGPLLRSFASVWGRVAYTCCPVNSATP